MEPLITREDLRGFLHTVNKTYVRTDEITPQFTKVLEALATVAYDDTVPTLAIAPEPALAVDDDIPF